MGDAARRCKERCTSLGSSRGGAREWYGGRCRRGARKFRRERRSSERSSAPGQNASTHTHKMAHPVHAYHGITIADAKRRYLSYVLFFQADTISFGVSVGQVNVMSIAGCGSPSPWRVHLAAFHIPISASQLHPLHIVSAYYLSLPLVTMIGAAKLRGDGRTRPRGEEGTDTRSHALRPDVSITAYRSGTPYDPGCVAYPYIDV